LDVTVQRSGGIWDGYVEGHPEVDERGLTEEMAKVKAERVVKRLREDASFPAPVKGVSKSEVGAATERKALSR